MAEYLCFQFERGGELTALLRQDIAPQTVKEIVASLPGEATFFHTRWCGREIYAPIRCQNRIGREHQTSQVNTGDVSFWREWESCDSAGAISLFYGAEQIRYITGPLQVNVFARISQEQWPFIEEIGLRIWQGGIEQVKISVR